MDASGVITFLFTDIEGSTRMLQRLGRARYTAVLDAHQRAVRSAFVRRGGEEIDTQGDAFFFAFANASDAVAAAVEAQRALLADEELPRVRIGINTGEATQANNRYVGIAVHRAARVCAAAHGGQILVSLATREVVADDLPGDVSLRDLGEQSLKDLERPVRLFQVVAPELPAVFPPLRLGAESPPAAPGTRGPRLRRRWTFAAVAAAAIAAAGGTAIALLFAGGSSPKPRLGSVPVLDESGAVTGSVPILARLHVGNGFGPMLADNRELWVISGGSGTLVRVSPDTNTVVGTIPAGAREDSQVADVGRRVWVTDPPATTVQHVSGTRRSIGGHVSLATIGDLVVGLSSEGRTMWVAVHRGTPSGGLVHLDARGRPLGRVIRLGSGYRGGPSWLSVAGRYVWVEVPEAEPNEQGVWIYRVPLSSGKPKKMRIPGGACGYVTSDSNSVWVASGYCGTGALTRIDWRTNSLTTIPPQRRWNEVFGATSGDGSVWFSTDKGVFALDPTTNHITQRLALEEAGDVLVAYGSLWIHQGHLGTLLRLQLPTT